VARRFGIDDVSEFLGLRWDDPSTARMAIRPELINAGGLLSGVATYGLVDYCMGSALWAQTTEDEAICRTVVDRRNRTSAVLRSTVEHADGRLMATAVGSYSIFPRRS
jgi:acyl-coenzyme A thioesterase PaaI-like protein